MVWYGSDRREREQATFELIIDGKSGNFIGTEPSSKGISEGMIHISRVLYSYIRIAIFARLDSFARPVVNLNLDQQKVNQLYRFQKKDYKLTS